MSLVIAVLESFILRGPAALHLPPRTRQPLFPGPTNATPAEGKEGGEVIFPSARGNLPLAAPRLIKENVWESGNNDSEMEVQKFVACC